MSQIRVLDMGRQTMPYHIFQAQRTLHIVDQRRQDFKLYRPFLGIPSWERGFRIQSALLCDMDIRLTLQHDQYMRRAMSQKLCYCSIIRYNQNSRCDDERRFLRDSEVLYPVANTQIKPMDYVVRPDLDEAFEPRLYAMLLCLRYYVRSYILWIH